MRRQMIEAITYPRMLLMESLDADECPQNLYFNPSHPACQYCEQGEECYWLNHNDEFSILAQKPMEELFGALRFCIDFVDARCNYQDHNVVRCACESCTWVRKARRLAWEYRGLSVSGSGRRDALD